MILTKRIAVFVLYSFFPLSKFTGGFVTGEGTISSSFNPVEFDRSNIDIGFGDGDVGTIRLRGDYQETNNTKHYIVFPNEL